jgi:hypothetical protein
MPRSTAHFGAVSRARIVAFNGIKEGSFRRHGVVAQAFVAAHDTSNVITLEHALINAKLDGEHVPNVGDKRRDFMTEHMLCTYKKARIQYNDNDRMERTKMIQQTETRERSKEVREKRSSANVTYP